MTDGGSIHQRFEQTFTTRNLRLLLLGSYRY